MSKAGHHRYKTADKPAPSCFKCGTQPRLNGHTVCAICHVEASCHRCQRFPTPPALLVRGVVH